VLSIARGETSVAEAARKPWPDRRRSRGLAGAVVAAAENALVARPKDEEALKDEQIKKLKQKVGELVLDLDNSAGGGEGPPLYLPRWRVGRTGREGDRLPGKPRRPEVVAKW
jgi:hypothetical protein